MTRLTHPLTLIRMMGRFLFLLVFPLFRGFLFALGGGSLQQWLAGTWQDLLIVLLIVFLAALEWWSMRWRCDPDRLYLRRGVFFRRERVIPAARIVTLSLVRPFFLRPFGAVRLRIDTMAGSEKKSDLSLLLYAQDAESILQLRQNCLHGEDFSGREYHPRSLYLTCLSALLSSSFAGVLYVSTFISRAGDLLGKAFSDRITGTFTRLVRALAWGLPPAAAAIGWLLLLGWLLSFARNLFRHYRFVVKREKYELFLQSGLGFFRRYSVSVRQIISVDIRRNPITQLLGLQSAFVRAAGYGKEKDDLSAMIPANPTKSLRRHLHFLLPEFVPSALTVRPAKSTVFSFLWQPGLLLLLLPAVAVLLSRLFPGWAEVIRPVAWMSLLPVLWFFAVRLWDLRTGGIGKNDTALTLCCSRRMQMHTMILPIDRVSRFLFRQSPWQMRKNRCDLYVYSGSEGRIRHRLRNLSVDELRSLLGGELLQKEEKKTFRQRFFDPF